MKVKWPLFNLSEASSQVATVRRQCGGRPCRGSNAREAGGVDALSPVPASGEVATLQGTATVELLGLQPTHR